MEEAVLTQLMGDPAVKHFSPVIDKKIKLAHGESVRLLGIDPFLDRYIRPELSSVPFDESNRQSPGTSFSPQRPSYSHGKGPCCGAWSETRRYGFHH